MRYQTLRVVKEWIFWGVIIGVQGVIDAFWCAKITNDRNTGSTNLHESIPIIIAFVIVALYLYIMDHYYYSVMQKQKSEGY